MLVACPHTALRDSRDFLAPIITAFEAELAFTPGAAWTPGQYRTGFPDAPPPPADRPCAEDAAAARAVARDAADASSSGDDEPQPSSSQQLIVRRRVRRVRRARACCVGADAAARPQVQGDRGVRAQGGAGGVAAVTTAAEFLTLRRTYQGLVPVTREGGDAPPCAAQGQTGRAAVYSGEGSAS